MSEKIRLRGQLKLPVVGKNPTFAQMKFVKVALSEPDILPDSGSIFTCDEQGNYDFEIYTGKHLLSYNVGNAWSKPIEIIAEPIAEGLESIEISDLIGFQEIPELDATIAALNQQKQELLLIQQDVVLKQEDAAASAEAAAADAAKLADVTPESIGAVSIGGLVSIIPSASYSRAGDGELSRKYFVIELPTAEVNVNTVVGMHLDLISAQSHQSNSIFVSFYNYTYANLILGASASQISMSSSLTVDFYRNTDDLKSYIAFSMTDGTNFSGSTLRIISVSLDEAAISPDMDAAKKWSSGWTVTSINEIPDSVGVKQATVVTGLGSRSDVVAVDYNGSTHYYNNKESARAVAGIPYEVFDAALAEQQAQEFFESEKAKAILIMNDHTLGTGKEEITDLQVMDVKAYIQSIDPSKGFKVGIVRAKVPRPSIFSRYD